MSEMVTFGLIGAYILLGRKLVSTQSKWRDAAFCFLNLAFVYWMFFSADGKWRYFVIYLILVVGQYLALRRWGSYQNPFVWSAFAAPLLILALIHYMPMSVFATFSSALRGRLAEFPDYRFGASFIGLSYLAFRTSYLALEVRNGNVARPNLWQYLGFSFFAPTLSVGPISPYSEHCRGFGVSDRPAIPEGRAFLRILVGTVKFKFLAPLLGQLGYTGLILDGNNPHPWVDMPIAMVAYYLFLYCNFSGFCDIAIGGAGLMGISVVENFDDPLIARNLKDFWNRWHITLSHYMRDVVFSPLSTSLVRAFGPKYANHAVAIPIVVVFLLVGIWHGLGWHYAAFGAAHAMGLLINHYYTLALKRRLGRDGFSAYNKNRVIHGLAVMMTFSYVAACLFLFANDWVAARAIFSAFHRD